MYRRLLAKKSNPAKKRKISAREFSGEFAKIVSGYLSKFTPEEQDKRIRSATRVAIRGSRASSAKARGVADTRPSPRSAPELTNSFQINS